MENIFYLDAKNGIEKFLANEFGSCPAKLKNRFLSFFSNLVNYEEEGEKLHPQILLTNNIDAIARYISDSYKITLFADENEMHFDSRMKALMPFTAVDWWIFINAKENEISYGIIKLTNSIKDPNFKDSIFSNYKLKEKQDKINLVLIEQYSSFVINFSSLSGNELNVNFSIDENLNSLNSFYEISEFTEASFSKLKTTAKKLNEIKNMFTQIFKTVTKKVHGALCVVVDKDYVDNGFFCDGVWLKDPISFSKVFLNSKSYSENKLETVANLFITMLNFDGITIIDNTGRIRAYNVFVETNFEKTKNVIGGARKRAAYTIINSRRKKIAGVYFQSHEGEIFYTEVKGYKTRTRKAAELEKNTEAPKNKQVEAPTNIEIKMPKTNEEPGLEQENLSGVLEQEANVNNEVENINIGEENTTKITEETIDNDLNEQNEISTEINIRK